MHTTIESTNIHQVAEGWYLDWFNHFGTIERMAEYYGTSLELTRELVELGKKYHEWKHKNKD